MSWAFRRWRRFLHGRCAVRRRCFAHDILLASLHHGLRGATESATMSSMTIHHMWPDAPAKWRGHLLTKAHIALFSLSAWFRSVPPPPLMNRIAAWVSAALPRGDNTDTPSTPGASKVVAKRVVSIHSALEDAPLRGQIVRSLVRHALTTAPHRRVTRHRSLLSSPPPPRGLRM